MEFYSVLYMDDRGGHSKTTALISYFMAGMPFVAATLQEATTLAKQPDYKR